MANETAANKGATTTADTAPPVLAQEVASGQWHLAKLGAIDHVWADYTGVGVTVGVYDTGVQYSHWDLDANYDPSFHVTIDGKTYDGDFRPASGPRGTSIAGLIAAENNGAGTVGVAYNATITSVNVFDQYSGEGLDPGIWINAPSRALFTEALSHRATMDIALDGWGRLAPDFSSASSRGVVGTDAAHFAAVFEYAARVGRNGLGTISVNSAGNTGRDVEGDSAFNSRHTITVGGYRQTDGYATTTSGRGASLLVSAPSGDPSDSALKTTDLLGRFGYNTAKDPGGLQDATDTFTGTAGAAAEVSGVVALMLQANGSLGWRDISSILASSATLPIDWNDRNGRVTAINASGQAVQVSANESWFKAAGSSGAQWNGGGLHYSSDYGYGAVNAHDAVRMAESASLFGPAKTSTNEVKATTGTMTVDLYSVNNLIDPSFYGSDFVGEPTEYQFTVGDAVDLEHVDLTLGYTNTFAGQSQALWGTKIKLIAPDGTSGFVDANAAAIVSTTGSQSFTFGFAGFQGVRAEGTWTLQFENAGPNMITRIETAKVDLFGSASTADDVNTFTDEYQTMVRVDPANRRVVRDADGGTDWINAAAVTSNINLSLVAGARTTFGGVAAFTVSRTGLIENAVTGDGNDTLTGNTANNILYGMRGNDMLNGGGGNDTLAGGIGDDVFRFDTNSGRDRILDWSKGDTIETREALTDLDASGNVTVGADGRLLLGSSGDYIELAGQAGSFLHLLGVSGGYNRYGWLSGNSIDQNVVMNIRPVWAAAAATAAATQVSAVTTVEPPVPLEVSDHPVSSDGMAAAEVGTAAGIVAFDSMGQSLMSTARVSSASDRYTTWGPESLSAAAAAAADTSTNLPGSITYPMPTSIIDPVATRQWHFDKLGNMDAIWADYTGRGIKVGVYDSGIQYAHEDLAANYDAGNEITVNGATYDGDFRPASGPHGTSVGGLIAAPRNGTGVVGVAYGATMTGVNIFDPYSGGGTDPGIFINASDQTLFHASMFEARRFDVVNHSWGRTTPGYMSSDSRGVFGTDAYYVAKSFEHVATYGRGGLGTISLAAAGNSSIDFQGDGSHTDRHVIAVGAYRQIDGLASNYSSRGPGLLISAPSSDFASIGGTGIVSTDLIWREGYNWSNAPGADTAYTDQFGGTSAAAPIASGVVALMLDANGGLGWRDVQTILASSATLPVPFEDRTRTLTYSNANGTTSTARMNEGFFSVVGSAIDWNGGGRHYSPDYGYGAINAMAAVRMAEVWSLFGSPQTSANEQTFSSETYTANLAPIRLQALNRDDSYSRFTSVPASYSFEITGADLSLEQVDMTITYKALLPSGGDRTQGFTLVSPIKIALTAPDGTEAFMDLLPTSATGIYSTDEQSFTFGFRNFMGASPNGTWTLKAESSFNTLLTINTVQVDLHGGSTNVDDVYTYTDEFFTMAAIAGQGNRTTLGDTNGGVDWINAAAISSDAQISLVEGVTSRFDGRDAYTIAANSAIENVVSGDGNDRLTGNSLDNKLYGMRGADQLNGGAGDDTLYGGSGNDVFVFNTEGTSGHDKIIDWSTGDRIATTKQLRGASFDGQITLGANGVLLLDGTVRGDTVDLVGHAGAVLQAMGRSDGYWWYAFVSGGSPELTEGPVREIALSLTDHRAYEASTSTALGANSTMHVTSGMDDHPFYLYNAMHDVMSTGVQVYA